MKKAIFVLVLLILAAGAVFYFGWVQFTVPAGQYGVIISKTGGVDPATVEPGMFRWQWEFLLPTNAQVETFSLTPATHTVPVRGTLPSGTLYASMLEGSPDFSWAFTCETTAHISPAMLPSLVEKNGIHTQEALDEWVNAALSNRMQTIAEQAVRGALSDIMQERARIHPEELAQAIAAELSAAQNELEVLSVTVKSDHFPDLDLYYSAAQTYEAYQKQRRVLWKKAAEDGALDSVSDYLSIERYTRWGELLTRYPVLIDFFSSAGLENHPLAKQR